MATRRNPAKSFRICGATEKIVGNLVAEKVYIALAPAILVFLIR
jgi:hypothetical protein